jgi:deoxyribose-phosphate aldolase
MNERVRLNAKTLAQMIDHTLLKPEATPAQIEALCAEAKEYEFATVCVNPIHVKLAARALAGAPVDVCTVVGFPLGATPTAVKVFETEQALADGAAEIDMVIPIGALKAGDEKAVREDIAAVVEAAHAAGGVVKVIIEAALLSDEEKKLACTLAVAAGADFVKTSTGFGPGGATRPDVSLMRDVVGAEVGVKAAGGSRSYADAQGMVEAGANRLGASAGVRLVSEATGMKGK